MLCALRRNCTSVASSIRAIHNPRARQGKSNFSDHLAELKEQQEFHQFVNQLPAVVSTSVKHLPIRTTISQPVFNSNNEIVSEIQLNARFFASSVRQDIVKRVVEWQRACSRLGTAQTKHRAEVSGTNKKPWQQKGLGRSRASTLRSPLMRGGGHAHPKRLRDWSYDVPRKVRAQALAMAVSAKVHDQQFVVIDQWSLSIFFHTLPSDAH